MNQQQLQKLRELFNQFAEEEQASSFAVNNLFNRTFQIIKESQQQSKGVPNDNPSKD